MPSKRPKRGPGRPQLGERTHITISPGQRATAEQLGYGVVAEGVRRALDMAAAWLRGELKPPPQQ